jgi:asparaginyl-tRNA synthetase
MQYELIRKVLERRDWGGAARVAGWVRTRRDSKGGFSFLELNDGSCLANLQVVAETALANYQTEVLKLFPGSSVAVEGVLAPSPGAGQLLELRATSVTVFGFCEPTAYPLQKGRVSFEVLREIGHLRPRTNTFGAMSRIRNTLAMATHSFFQEHDFLYVHTPIITGNDCEGAGAMFQVTTLDVGNPPRRPDGAVDYAADFFGRRVNLTVSGQLNGETHACALGRIYTFGPTFRAENSNTRRHLAEFWMIEPEIAFADLADDAALAEAFLRHLFQQLLARCRSDLEFFQKQLDPALIGRLETLAVAPFLRMSYTEAVAALRSSGQTFEFPVQWGCDLQAEHEKYLTEVLAKGPVIVTDYPREIKAFYMRQNADGRTVAAMDVLLPEVGEIIGGSQREDRLDVLEARMRGCGLNPELYSWYLDLRRFGSVPHAGFGLGFERLVQFCTGLANIRDVIPFPRTPGNAAF